MPRKPKTTLDLPKTNSTPTQRQFTDREMPQQIFTDALATVNQQNYSILTFYGVGGIGKTRLQEHLQQAHLDQDENSLYSKVNFQNPDNRQPYRALRTLVKNFTGEPKIAFNAFGLAYMQYWEKAFPDQDIKKEGLPFLEEGSLLATAADVVDEVGGVASLAVGALDYLYRKVKERNFDEAIYNRLKALESKTADDIEDSLPLFFAYDIERYKIKHPEKKIVIFLDTYEALWTDKRSEANEFSEDQWLRDGLVTELQQVLFVICGREKLIWDKEDNAWQSDLNQHLIGNLSDLDAGKFLSSCQIINPELQQRIIADSEGVPFYLDLCVDTFERIQQHRTPTADDFARVGKAELFERFMRYLDRSETETLKMLAFPRFYTADIFSLLVREFETGYRLGNGSTECLFFY